ncbi:hypothetical protein N7510_005958 [Penicillium lagena]|uniref:uncharacterized protein n=1 Tax=Penicillium lagena TaxID=94218 RepID=UPI00253FF39A|nr:uncharacterized protein N7510_005958 [Penicillium lagena]KAJ5612764.1 hypothetical protein N7510_005958 [Penicillium lagena]
MPAPVEPTNFVVVVRDLGDDEHYVMEAFESHAEHCPHCADPLQTHRDGGDLCERGRQYARDVAEYLYCQNGKHYSVVDRESGQPKRVKLPRDALAVRSLLAALEDGLRLRAPAVRAPEISYDRTYPVGPRRPAVEHIQPRPSTPESPSRAIIEREPRSPKRRTIVYHSPRVSPARGSLYNADRVDRVERLYESSRIYRPAEYYR